MEKQDFKTILGVQIIANLSFAIFIMLLASCIIFAIKPNNNYLILVIGMFSLYIISFLLNLYASKKIKEIQFLGTTKDLANKTAKTSKWFLLPFIFSIFIQTLRTAMWEYYTKEQTQHLTKESEIMKINICLLEELRDDGYISHYTYNKKKQQMEEALKEIITIENKKQPIKVVTKKKWEDD